MVKSSIFKLCTTIYIYIYIYIYAHIHTQNQNGVVVVNFKTVTNTLEIIYVND